MITNDQAERIAVEYLSNMERRVGIPLQLTKKLDGPFGWVFFYNSRAYIESGNISAMLAGNSPFLIDSYDGTLHVLGTAYPVEQYLAEYGRSRVKPDSSN
jgi:Immunity protein 35